MAYGFEVSDCCLKAWIRMVMGAYKMTVEGLKLLRFGVGLPCNLLFHVPPSKGQRPRTANCAARFAMQTKN